MYLLLTKCFQGFPGDSDRKESACHAGDLGLIPGLERSPEEGNANPLQYSCLDNPHGQRSLVGYSSWGCKESDTTERLSTTVFNYAYMLSHFNPIWLCDPMDHNPSGFSVQVIILARILEWVAMSSWFPCMCVCVCVFVYVIKHVYTHVSTHRESS